MATSFSWRGILHTLFDADDADLGDIASPLASARTPRWSGRLSAASPSSSAASSPSSSRVDVDDTSLPYSPRRLDGEFNVWFSRKPLGLGLVPSTQLYGTWEVSTIAPPTNTPPTSPSRPPASSRSPVATTDDEDHSDHVNERQKIAHGDVIIAVNFSTKIAQLPGDKFTAYLKKSTCPIVVTLRRPTVYGTFASRAVSTAMFPTSFEYRGRGQETTKFHARASSAQWKRSLQHELSKKKTNNIRNNTTPSLPEPAPEVDPPTATAPADLSSMGEYTHTFHSLPLHLVLAPSTRPYGSVEVYDAKQLAPRIQIGDVVMAVNGDSTVAQWPTDEAIDHIAQLEVPVTITFRRPTAYRQYLEQYFKTTNHTVSSRSTATAMFPDSAEYKHGFSKVKTQVRKTSQVSRRDSFTTSTKSTISQTRTTTTAATTSKRDKQPPMSKQEWQLVSKALDASDQFTLWHSGRHDSKSLSASAKKRGKQDLASVTALAMRTSAFLTERHVHYLWSHLPEYLTCNDMELVYDTRRHGWNILSFYARVQDKGPSLLVVKDTRDQIFGCFSSASWNQSTDTYGNGRCFVFTLRPQMRVYPWSGLENTFMYGRNDAIIMGGGKNGMALCIQLDELRGFTNACETFDSPPLAQGHGGNFDMENMEVWCFSGLRV